MRREKAGDPSERVLMLDLDLPSLDPELLLDLAVIDIGRQKLPTRQRLPHMRNDDHSPSPGSHMQQVKTAAELQGSRKAYAKASALARRNRSGEQWLREGLGARNLLSRFRWIGDALERDCGSVTAWWIVLCNQGVPFMNS